MDGYIKWLREQVGSQKILLAFASVCIVDRAGRLLWQQRGDFGWWGLPGGMLEPGERIDQTAINEVREETGLIIEPLRLLGVYSNEQFRVLYPHGDEVKFASCLFKCHIIGGELKADMEEIVDARFFPPDQLPKLPERHAIRVAAALANQSETIIS